MHPGAVLIPAALAIAQEEGLGGRALLTAVVAGCEVLFRIGRATKHSAETRGFHAPGTTGPFGGAVTVGKLLQLDAGKMTNALGIAGSLSGGLLEFAHSNTGAMVKKLHLGRAAESGVLAATVYHVANGVVLVLIQVVAIRELAGMYPHIQIAGTPGRHEPDVGEINYPYLFDLLDEIGYQGWVGCEYRPKGDTVAGLGWAKQYGIG